MDVLGERTETTDEITHMCAPDTFCYNDGMVECDSTAPFDELASSPEVLSETGDASTTLNNEDSETINLGGNSMTSGISNLNTLTVPSLSSSDTTQEGTEENPSEDSNLTDTTDMTEMQSTDFSASSNALPESPMSTLVPEYTEMRLNVAATDETPATFENSANEDLETGDRAPTSTSNTVDEASLTLSAAMPSLESESSTVTNTTSESSPESTTVVQSSTTEKRFFCELPGSYPHESNCHKYYVCVQRPYGFIRLEVSCYFNMAFDPALHRCVFSQRACHPTREAFVCPSDGKFPDSSGSGGKYYWCVENGTDYLMYQMRCPYGQRFNADAGQCQDWSGPDVVITSGGMQTVVVDDSGDSSSESDDSDDSNE